MRSYFDEAMDARDHTQLILTASNLANWLDHHSQRPSLPSDRARPSPIGLSDPA